ncbi:acyltransferase [Vibrio atlanticus]|uniref:2,3,4,5-tetrahydropyridine-2,6-dicarboxylate N-acetyltransferase n=1 Tax=Vibrio atlanticus TaxID=693153 RepID=A0A1C3IIG2_9VIBR|nr:acyltransferase [Vibrio atlanticus]SBS61190.1 2,3,4,5-tetrahydropyridine-2,6-dicarboxylate N-acetyltransferase [Vibrio atlanticus]
MVYSKFFWAFRLFVLSVFYKNIKFPGYLGKPIFLLGIKSFRIGQRVRIFPNARMEVHGENAYINIDDNVSIGQGFHATSGGELNIGSDTVISGNVVVTNIDHDYKNIELAVLEQPNLISATSIGEGCFIGFGAIIQAGTSLGKHCIVGANSVVRGEFPDYCVIVGSPAKIVKRYDVDNGLWERTNSKGEFLNP